MFNLQNLETKVSESIKHFKEQSAGIRSGRPTPKLVEDITAEYFGQKLTIKQMGSISIVPPREINITVWDKQAIPAIIKAIESSSLNISAHNEGNLIRINLPSLSEERRQELVKLVKKEAEETRIKIRTIRDALNKEIKMQFTEGKINEDDVFKLKEKVQEVVDKANEEIEKTVENKAKEIKE